MYTTVKYTDIRPYSVIIVALSTHLTGVFFPLWVARTHHAISDHVAVPVILTTYSLGNDGHVHLLELPRRVGNCHIQNILLN